MIPWEGRAAPKRRIRDGGPGYGAPFSSPSSLIIRTISSGWKGFCTMRLPGTGRGGRKARRVDDRQFRILLSVAFRDLPPIDLPGQPDVGD